MTDTPHDALFRFAFSRPELAADELRLILPPELVARADWSTLAPQPGSFIDDDLSNRACDLLFSVQLGGRTTLLYVLFEHQSTRDRWTPLRLLRCQVRIWTQYLHDHPEAEGLPPIISAVLQHDPRSGPPPPCFAELLDADEDLMALLQPFVPDFRFALDDLREADSEELRRRSMAALGRLALWCLKNGRDVGEIVDRLEEWADVFWEVRSAPHGVEATAAVMRYIRRVNDEVPNERLEKLLESVLDAEFREVYVTEGERLIQQGIEQGIEQGVVKGARRVLLRQLHRRFGELDDTLVARVETASEDQIERWAERVLDAETLEDVLA